MVCARGPVTAQTVSRMDANGLRSVEPVDAYFNIVHFGTVDNHYIV